jgi:D-beta-D-heptose 7-phosphate kinase / D-beta-D-heptose 1-phosphate adenosyltransferase
MAGEPCLDARRGAGVQREPSAAAAEGDQNMRVALDNVLEDLTGVRCVVVGDAVLDRWLAGAAARVSREAPVAVVDVADERDSPGAAANAAANAAAMGAHVMFVSVVGDDDQGRRLIEQLQFHGVDTSTVVRAEGRTATKTRLLAGGHPVARFDGAQTTRTVPRGRNEAISRALERALQNADVLIVSDYGGGVLDGPARDLVRRWHGGPVIVDAHDLAQWRDVKPYAMTPNFLEAVRLLGEAPSEHEDRSRWLAKQSVRLLAAARVPVLAVTIDHEGAVLLQRDSAPVHIATPFGHVDDTRTVGAGDAFTAAFSLALGTGASPVIAAELGSMAASLTVRTAGTGVCSREDLVVEASGPILDAERLAQVVASHRRSGRRIVFTNGCFDVLHRGHVTYLREARAMGDVLIVAVNSDEGVRQLKGADRPLNGLEDRAAVLDALGCVDHLVAFDETSPRSLIELVRPDVYVKGGDYSLEMIPEAALVHSLGGRVRVLSYVPDRSTSALIHRLRAVEESPSSAVQAGEAPVMIDLSATKVTQRD